MKKILFYINSIHYGGAERVIVNLANEFSKRKYQVVFVTSFKDSQEYLLQGNIERLSLEDSNLKESFIKKNIIRTLKLRKICKDQKPDILISFMAEANFRSIVATRFLNIKNLISVRNDPCQEYPNILFRMVARLLYPLVSGCVFQTEDAKNYFSGNIQKKSKIILNHVEEKFYKTKYNGIRKNIVSVGRLEVQKNHDLLIKAFSIIAADFPEEQLIIYGEGSQRKSLENLVLVLNLEKRVIFRGAVDNIQENIKDAKLFILSSNYEGLPNALMEAMALGIPVISTDCPCGGPKTLINNEKDGVLVKLDDDQGLANAMIRVLSEPVFADILSKNARIKSKEFESSKIFKIWEDYILSIINGM